MRVFPLNMLHLENSIIHSPRKERGVVWRDTPTLMGGVFELLLIYDQILKGWGVAVARPQAVGVIINRRLQFVPTLSSACGCRVWLVTFSSCLPVISSPGDQLRGVKWQSCLTRSHACLANGAPIANGTGFALSELTWWCQQLWITNHHSQKSLTAFI